MLCIVAVGAITALAATDFTLEWTHSVERTQWLENWTVEGDQLRLTAASVEGPGAGIAVPAGAVWADGRWSYVPMVPPIRSLSLAASGMTPGAWTLCAAGGQCLTLGAEASEPVRLWSGPDCDAPD